jgi:hypothetical protein
MQNLNRGGDQATSQGKPVDAGRGDLFPGGSDWMQFDPTVRPSAFDFNIPDWMFPPIRCPDFPNEGEPYSIQEQKMFLIKRAFQLDEWLAAKGCPRNMKIGYLGLSFDAKSGLVSREGYIPHFRLGPKLARLFNALLHAGPTGLDDCMLDEVYPGTKVTRRRAKTELRQKLDPLWITIPDGGWVLKEKRRQGKQNRQP